MPGCLLGYVIEHRHKILSFCLTHTLKTSTCKHCFQFSGLISAVGVIDIYEVRNGGGGGREPRDHNQGLRTTSASFINAN